MDALQIFREVAHVVGYLQTEFAGRGEDQCLWQPSAYLTHDGAWLLGYSLQYGDAECSSLARTRLGQGYHIVTVT